MNEILTKAVEYFGSLEALRICFNQHGPFITAKEAGLLVNNSGEELAVSFMGYYNANVAEVY